MSADDAARWDARYADAGLATPAPPDAWERYVTGQTRHVTRDPMPTSGRALDVACGIGAQAAWLAARGLDVIALDASRAAVDLTMRAAQDAGVSERVTGRVADLDRGLPDDIGRFDVIVCQRFRAIDLYDAFIERLRPDGLAVVTVLSRTGADNPGPFHAPSGELRAAFTRPDTELLFHHESDGQESVIVQCHASHPS